MSLSAAINAPIDAIDFANVEKYTSIPSWQPCSSPAPAPVLPNVPNPCASSTNKRKLYFSFNATISFIFPCCPRSEEHTSELQSRENLVCRLLLEKKNKIFLLR